MFWQYRLTDIYLYLAYHLLMAATLSLPQRPKLLDSLYHHRQAFIVAIFGGGISLAGFISVQMKVLFNDLSLVDYLEWHAWFILGIGLLLTAIFSILLYARISCERRTAEYAMQLERSNRDLDSFAAIASHDLKEPLRTIQSYTELIMRREEMSESSNKYLDTIADASTHMQEMLYHIRHYARLGADIDNKDEIICMNKVWHCVETNLSQLIEGRNAVLAHNDLPQLIGSQIQIMQLLQNLVSNAIRYCPVDRVPEISLMAEQIENGWKFTLSDNGEGIPEDARDTIFQPFKRYSQQKVSGSGLGLSICRRIVEAHGGDIYCEANSIDGTSFIFTIKEEIDG